MPIDVEALFSSARFQALKDFQKWWFMAVIFGQWNQRMPGHIEITENFYRIVGAHSRPMWETHSGEVMAAFERVERDGKQYLYSPKVEELWNQQRKKHESLSARGKRGKQISQSSVYVFVSNKFSESIWKAYPQERRVEKPRAIAEIEKALERLQNSTLAEYSDRFGKNRMVPIESDIDAAEFLQGAVDEYRESPAGRNWQFVPYPERWFKREKYLEPRAAWFMEGGGATNGNQKAAASDEAIRRAISGVVGTDDEED